MIQVLDPKMLQEFLGAKQAIPLCDSAGNLLGHFVPSMSAPGSRENRPQISEEEIRRREAQSGGRALANILADLKAGA